MDHARRAKVEKEMSLINNKTMKNTRAVPKLIKQTMKKSKQTRSPQSQTDTERIQQLIDRKLSSLKIGTPEHKKVSTFKAGYASRVYNSLLTTLMTPSVVDSNSKLERMYVEGKSTPTSVATLQMPILNPPFDPNGNLTLYVSRNPGRSVVYNDPNPSSVSTTYTAAMIDDNTYTPFLPPQNTATLRCPWAQTRDLPIEIWTSNSAYQPHGPTLFTGSILGNSPGTSNRYWTWMDRSSVVTLTGAASAAGMNIMPTFWYNNEFIPASTSVALPTTPGATVILSSASWPTASMTGAYVKFVLGSNSGTTFLTLNALNFVNTGPNTCHLALPNLLAKAATFQSIAVTAVDVLVSNVTSLNSKQGEVTAVQPPTGNHYTEYLNDPSITTTIGALPGAITNLNLANGVFGYIKPNLMSDFETKVVVSSTKDYFQHSKFDWASSGDYIIIVCSNQSVPQTLRVIVTSAIEFSSDDRWYDKAQTRVTELAQKSAVEAISKAPQFYENPLHLASIGNFIKRAVTWTADNAPSVLNAIQAISKLF